MRGTERCRDNANHSCNLPLSSVTNQIDPSKGKVLQDYIPPHPQKGTPYHRYTFILFEQRAEIPGGAAVEKGNFEHRSFVQARALRPVGVNFFRQVWDGTVSQIYKDTLSEWVLYLTYRQLRGS